MALGALCGCGTAPLAPHYIAQGLLSGPDRMDPTLTIVVVDKIETAAPAPVPASFLGIRHNRPGEQIVCPECAYRLDALPVEAVQRIAAAALRRKTVTPSRLEAKRLEITLQQFEFFTPGDASGQDLHVIGRVALRTRVIDRGVVLADKTDLESSELRSGSFTLESEIEEFVSRTISAALERALTDPQVFAALQH